MTTFTASEQVRTVIRASGDFAAALYQHEVMAGHRQAAEDLLKELRQNYKELKALEGKP